MKNFADFIITAYNTSCLRITGKEMTISDCDKVRQAEKLLRGYDGVSNIIANSFVNGISSIRTERWQDGKRRTKWSTAVPLLVARPTNDFILGKELMPEVNELVLILRLILFYESIFFRRKYFRYSHPFLTEPGEVDKAKSLGEIMRGSNFKATEGYLVSVGGLIGFSSNGNMYDLNTKVFLDNCKYMGIRKVIVNTIDATQIRQIIKWGEYNGLEMVACEGDGLTYGFRSDEPSVVVVDGYGKFQTVDYLKEIKEGIPNSLVILTLAKSTYRIDKQIMFPEQVFNFIESCDYNCYYKPYGKNDREGLIVINNTTKEVGFPSNDDNNIYVKDLFCKCFG